MTRFVSQDLRLPTDHGLPRSDSFEMPFGFCPERRHPEVTFCRSPATDSRRICFAAGQPPLEKSKGDVTILDASPLEFTTTPKKGDIISSQVICP